jgi:hypothetical protein
MTRKKNMTLIKYINWCPSHYDYWTQKKLGDHVIMKWKSTHQVHKSFFWAKTHFVWKKVLITSKFSFCSFWCSLNLKQKALACQPNETELVAVMFLWLCTRNVNSDCICYQQNKINGLTILGSWLWCSSKFLTLAIVSWALESDQALIWEFLSKFLLISSLCTAIPMLVNIVSCQVVCSYITGNKGHGKGVGLGVSSGVNTGVTGYGIGWGVDSGVGLVDTFKFFSLSCPAIARVGQSLIMLSHKFPYHGK